MKKIMLRMIFFFNKGVVTFLNRIFPSRSPVTIAARTKNGNMTESTVIVEESIS